MISMITSLRILAFMTLLLGGLYPASVWLVGQALFHKQANGSLIYAKGQVIGSELIAQRFVSDKYFWSRPSATPSEPYQFLGSSGSHLSPANPFLIESLRGRTLALRKNTTIESLIPIDLITSSASGLDPDISPAAARTQVNRIAKARRIQPQELLDLIDKHTQTRTFGFIGEARVNVLLLNLDLAHQILGDL
ncbi:MAG: potassium-transporting ATPase subunit KdpC [Alphaproteobacteria bacterium]|nr:potassium-transporting ATPase subunit KdpC [Alphaproteobacteria bacterium]